MLAVDDCSGREQRSPEIVLILHVSADYIVEREQFRIFFDEERYRACTLGGLSRSIQGILGDVC